MDATEIQRLLHEVPAPCPFCGGKAECFMGRHSFTDIILECSDCGAEGPMFDADTGDNEADKATNAANAIKHWNTRVSIDRAIADRLDGAA